MKMLLVRKGSRGMVYPLDDLWFLDIIGRPGHFCSVARAVSPYTDRYISVHFCRHFVN